MNKIKFYVSTFYKFQNLNIGVPLTLLEVFIKETNDLSEAFNEYENTYWDWEAERAELLDTPKGEKVLVLLFKDETSHVFTMVRKYSEGNYNNYHGKRGELFMIDVIKRTPNDVF